MFVKTINTFNFQGLKGLQSFELDKITALAQPNGSGKTSLINALRFGLTGNSPKGNMINIGEQSAAVKLILENGSNFSRQVFATKGKSAKYYISDKPTNATELSRFISSEMGGVDKKVAKFVSSGELLTSMTSQEFGELLLSYLPETMTAETVISHYPSANEEQKKIIREYFLDKEFEISELKEFQKFIKGRRDRINEAISNCRGALNLLGDTAPKFTKEELEEKIAVKTKERDDLLAIQANLNNYNQLLRQEQFRQQELERLDKELANLNGVAHTEEELRLANELVTTTRTSAMQTRGAIEALVSAKQDLDTAIENISKPICPLSDKIVCTVDKRPVTKELEEKRDKLIEDYKTQRSFYEQTLANIKEYENRYAQMAFENQQFILMQEKQQEKERLLAQKIEIPEKPEETNSLERITQELQYLQSQMPIVENYSKKDTYLNNIEKLTKKLEDYQALYVAFSPKGEVKEKITSYYLEEFAEPCNEKAGKLFPGMKLKFITQDGVKVLTDPNGSGEYLEFNSLSGGEQASVMFLLVSMLSSLSGMGIIILDELSVLDDNTFENLIRILKENSNEYDMCLIALVDHADMIKTLNKHEIPILSVNKTEKTSENEEKTDEELQNQDSSMEVVASVEDVEKPLVDEVKGDLAEEAEETVSTEPVISDKTSQIENLRNMMNKTLEENAETRFVPTDDFDESEFDEDGDETPKEEVVSEEKVDDHEASVKDKEEKSLESIGLSKGKSRAIVQYMIDNSDEEHFFYGTAKEISEAINISQPTISKVVKKLQEEEFVTLLKRGVWKLSDVMFG
jgi:DNA repair exonuclease SbcCD ATPase subunit/DNA-binding transcriptional ArsR family regulator